MEWLPDMASQPTKKERGDYVEIKVLLIEASCFQNKAKRYAISRRATVSDFDFYMVHYLRFLAGGWIVQLADSVGSHIPLEIGVAEHLDFFFAAMDFF